MSQTVAPQLDPIAEETASQIIAEGSLTSIDGEVVEDTTVSPVVDAKEQEQLAEIMALSTSEALSNFYDYKRLGAGSFGVTYSAKDRVNNNTIVVKQIDKQKSRRDLVDEEVKVLHQFQSVCKQYILCYVNFTEDSNNYYIITEFLGSYITLADYINQNRGTQSSAMTYKITSNLLRGIQQIHEKNVAHRDIKPENIMVNPLTGDIKYIDFGLSCFDHDCDGRGISGSDAFMAPEIRYGQPPFDKDTLIASDLWSLAFTIYELIVVKLPSEVYFEQIYMPMLKLRNPQLTAQMIRQPSITQQVFDDAIYQASTQDQMNKAVDLIPRQFQSQYPQVIDVLKNMMRTNPADRSLMLQYFI